MKFASVHNNRDTHKLLSMQYFHSRFKITDFMLMRIDLFYQQKITEAAAGVNK